jgi:hypothetical protein
MKTLRLMPLFASIFAGACVGVYAALPVTSLKFVMAGMSVYAVLVALYAIKSSR